VTRLSAVLTRMSGYTTKTDTAYEVLREAILCGALAPGASVQPKLVAEELDMSVIPVREALRRLEQDGLVEIRPHVGATVRRLADEELEETLLIRGELEALATRLAVVSLRPETIETLESLVEQMEECVRVGSPERFGEINREFHLELYRSTPYTRLYRLIESLWDQVPRARSVFALAPDHMRRSQDGHHRLLDACKRRDAEAAERVIREQKIGVLGVMKDLDHHEPDDRGFGGGKREPKPSNAIQEVVADG